MKSHFNIIATKIEMNLFNEYGEYGSVRLAHFVKTNIRGAKNKQTI